MKEVKDQHGWEGSQPDTANSSQVCMTGVTPPHDAVMMNFAPHHVPLSCSVIICMQHHHLCRWPALNFDAYHAVGPAVS